MDTHSIDRLSTTFAALANPTRLEILHRLTSGKKTVTELAEPFDMTMPAMTKHLKVLEAANLIERTREAQYRPCTLNTEPLEAVDRWMEQYRKFFEESFDRLDEYLQKIQAKEEHDEHR